MFQRLFSIVVAVLTGLVFFPSFDRPARAADIDFSHDVVPILRKRCVGCHSGDKKQGGLSMNTRAELLAGGENGKVVTPGKNGTSRLIERVTSADADARMPPEGAPLTPQEITVLRRWIDANLPWDEGFAFRAIGYEPPLKPRTPELPPPRDGRSNPVDRIVDAYWSARGVERPRRASDATLVRRLSLDLTGLLPDPKTVESFCADPSAEKRTRLVQTLLADDIAYADHWLTFWNDLLRNDYTGTGFITGGRKQITTWLYGSLRDNKPYDQLVRELIAPTPDSEGFIQGIRWRGNVSASQTQDVQFAQNISQAFLGINLKCASCHDSFIDRWKLDEAYGLAAVYATQPLEIHRCDKPTGAKARAAWLFPELGQIDPNAAQPARLKQLAGLMTHADNGRFTRTIVNRLWHRMMGRGIVHPVDAMHTPPWNADLLDWLASDFAAHGYDLKHTLAVICSSETYQSHTAPIEDEGETGAYVFRGPLPRRMTAEQFVDSVWQITGAGLRKPDAAVLRAPRNNSADPANAPANVGPSEPRGQWIWSYRDASGAVPKAGEAITVRKKFKLDAVPRRATAAITCDNGYWLYVNGQSVLSDEDWESVEAVPCESYLRTGDNEIVIVARNGGGGPNPAGLYFELRWLSEGKAAGHVATDASWEWTGTLPNNKGKFPAGKEPKDWKPTEPVANPGVWMPRVRDGIVNALQNSNTPAPMVRASLVKSDYLMRSLGRPNRDQIVTSRPNDLTTLEAIDLANGQILADALQKGGQRLLAEHGGSADAMIVWLYEFGLSRQPSAEELALAREAVGSPPSAQGIEDVLWAVLMLPEFQLVR